MSYSATVANQALDSITGGTTNCGAFVSLHTGAPGGTGANEATGGGYARQACTWNAASARAKTNSSSLTFSTTGVTANTNAGTSSAVTAGTYGIDIPLSSSVTAASITVAPGALSLTA
jgi:hypothetical protein